MSAGGVVSYYARPNKAIERAAFVFLIERIGRFRPLDSFEYFGLGGPFLEDCAMVARHFPFRSIWSLERDDDVVKRARANRPNSRVKIRKEDVFDFVEQHDFCSPSVFWLDYASPRELGAQLRNFEALCKKLPLGSVVKITLNASPDTLDPRPPEHGTDVQGLFELRVGPFMERAGNYCDDELETSAFTRRGYPRTLSSVVLTAIRRATRYREDVVPIPLTAFTYADTKQQMLTVAIALECDRTHEDFEKRTGMDGWSLRWQGEGDPISIHEPNLSLRERIELDRHLPDAGVDELSSVLSYQVGETARDHRAILESYCRFHDLVPYVAPVVV